MPVIGFDEGKNKANVYKTDETTQLLSAKQDKHTTQTETLLAANWSNKTQTINVPGVTANNTILVSAVPASVSLYGNCGVICTTQGNGTLTFTCGITPSNDISINIIILGV